MTHHNHNSVEVLSAGTLKGTSVTNSQGEDLGEVEEIMLDLQNGRVAYAVLSFGGLLGMGDKLFAIPWEALEIDQKKEKVVTNITKEKLKNAPGFDKDNWPQTANTAWLGEVHSYYGYTYS